MTAMSISQESGAVEADQAETEEGDDEDTSNSTGEPHVSLHHLHKVREIVCFCHLSYRSLLITLALIVRSLFI